MTNKELQKEISKLYQTVFMDLSNYDNFIFEDTRTYSNHDDYIDNYYISPPYRLIDSDGTFRFYIKKHWFNLRVEVRTECDIKNNWSDRKFNIYRDTLWLKRKNKIKSKALEIINFTDYNIIMKRVNNSVSFARKMKMKKLKQKLG
jgi:hypothetical protein